MARVLVIEDEEMLRSSMVRGLSKLPDVTVAGAGTLNEALALIDAEPPELVLSDLDLPERSGIELIGELASRRLDIPIVYITAYLRAYGSQIPPHAAVEVLEKPIELEKLRELVLGYLDPAMSHAESAPPFGLVDYVQLAAIGGHSVRVTVVGVDGGEGEVIVHGGEVWSAEDESGEGRDAFFRLVAAKVRSVECKTHARDPGARTIEGRWEELILEGARLSDEEAADATDTDDAIDRALDEGFRDADGGSHPGSDGFSEAMERGLEAMLAKDYEQALAAFEAAAEIRPDDRVVEANLRRLEDMGIGNQGSGTE